MTRAKAVTTDELPVDVGYRMPAEWEPHAATWLAWPHEKKDWPGKFEPIPWVYAEVVRHLVPGERVRILVESEAAEKTAKKVLTRAGVELAFVDFYRIPTDRSWTRDFCPLFVKSSEGDVALTNWKFNGWAKYPNHKRDDAVPDQLARKLKRRQWKPTLRIGNKAKRLVLEGGSIDVNGKGTLLTTEECLLSDVQQRNPGVSKEEIEQALFAYLGARKVLWLGEGIVGDDTHGHVDDLARFVDARTVVVCVEDDPLDDNFYRLRENSKRLESMTDQDGQPLRVLPLPMPEPVVFDGQRLPASYANFYIGNSAVLVPTFNDRSDRLALERLSSLFPTRKVVGIHALDLVWGLGTLHCMTQQEPAQQD
jgi:agmatine deiminase